MKRPRMLVPVWSVKSVAVLSVITVGVVTGCVFLIDKPVIWELRTTLAVLAGMLFTFLAVGLYSGVRLKQDPKQQPRPATPEEKLDLHHDPDLVDAGADIIEAVAEPEPEGCLGALLVGVLMFLASVVFLWLVSLLWESGILFVFAAGVYWLFSRALRQVFLKSRICRDNVLQTLRYSFMYTTLYTGWMFALLFIGQKLVR